MCKISNNEKRSKSLLHISAGLPHVSQILVQEIEKFSDFS